MEEIAKEEVLVNNENPKRKKHPIIISICSVFLALIVVFIGVFCVLKNNKKQEEHNLFSRGLVAVKTEDGWGYMNRVGEIIIKPQFEEAYPFSENGLAMVFLDGHYGFINTYGRYMVNPIYTEVRPFEDDAELTVVKRNGKYGYVDEEGDEEIICQFEEAYSFHSDLALVRQGGKYGFINDEGKFEINPIYDNAFDFNENGIGAVGKLIDGTLKIALIDEDGKLVTDFIYRNVLIGDTHIVAYDGEFYYLYNYKVKQLFKTQYQIAGVESGGIVIDPLLNIKDKLIAFRNSESKYGFLNLKGEVVIPANYDIIGNFYDGLALVKKDGKYGFINKNNELIVNNKYDFVKNYSDGYAVVSENYLYGLINTEGEVVLETKYSEIGEVNNDICYFKTANSNSYGYYDVENMKEINTQQYARISDDFSAYNCTDDGYIVVKQGDLYGVIDKKGNYAINAHLLDICF